MEAANAGIWPALLPLVDLWRPERIPVSRDELGTPADRVALLLTDPSCSARQELEAVQAEIRKNELSLVGATAAVADFITADLARLKASEGRLASKKPSVAAELAAATAA